MKIRIIWLIALQILLLTLFPIASAQEPVEAAVVRGHFSNGDGLWRADDFGWFYYDLDDAVGGEQLKIDLAERTAEKGHIVYSSRAWLNEFEYEAWGSYQAVAFLGKRYLAGYPKSTFTEEISSLEKGELREVLIDNDDVRTLSYNSTLTLKNGYVLTVQEISRSTDEVFFSLLKNGKPVDAKVVSSGDSYIYKVSDVPVILVHLSNAMSGGNNMGLGEVNGVFQVSDLPDVKLSEGRKLGNMEVTDVSEEGLELKSDKDLTLSAGSVVILGGNLVLTVVDDPELAYYPLGFITDYGVKEIRGPVFTADSRIPVHIGQSVIDAEARWDTSNFSGFYFDPDKNIGDESLVLFNTASRSILRIGGEEGPNGTQIMNGMQYNTLVQDREFEYEDWGSYRVVSFLGQLWFAGYSSKTNPEIETKDLLAQERLSQVLTDSDDINRAVAGNVFRMTNGYDFLIRDISKDTVFIHLIKDGQFVDSSVVKSNSTYVYKKDVGDIDDVPVLIVHVQNIFSDGTTNVAIIDGLFQISDLTIPMESGMDVGEMTVIVATPDYIIMGNPESISLNRDSTTNQIWPGVRIRVADNDTLRYYLYTQRYVVPKPGLTKDITYTRNVPSSGQANMSMSVKAAEISQVSAEIIDPSQRTVYFRDITKLGEREDEDEYDLWNYSWSWNASVLKLSDNGSQILDAAGNPMLALLYLNQSSQPVQVSVKFDESGNISGIADSSSNYYLSPAEYAGVKSNLSYGEMLANETARREFIKITPGISLLRFFEFINGTTSLESFNHTLTGTPESLEPHLVRVGAPMGRYEIQLRIENIADALRVSGIFFNVTGPEMRDIFLGSVIATTGGTATVPIVVPASGGDKSINISYDPAVAKATGVTGCNASWQADQELGRINVTLPAGCGAANLTFAANKVNADTDLLVVGTSGFYPQNVTNGSITVVQGKKSPGPGLIFALGALALAALLRRRA